MFRPSKSSPHCLEEIYILLSHMKSKHQIGYTHILIISYRGAEMGMGKSANGDGLNH